MTVSVIISSYNYEKYITDTIQSVLDQTFEPNEIIIVDDGSTDNSVERIKEKFNSKVSLIEQKNKGACSARNHGAKLATSDILAFVDSDDIWLPQKLEYQMREFENDPQVGIVSCGFRAFDDLGNTLYVNNKGQSGWVADKILLFKESVLNTTASAIAVRRSVFEKIGGFDERREMFSAEDRNLCYRASLISKLSYVNKVLLDYRIHGKNGHMNFRRMEKAYLFSYKTIFNGENENVMKLERRTYGNLATMFAGIYFQDGDYISFFRSTIKSLILTPSNITQFLGFPKRILSRRIKALTKTNN